MKPISEIALTQNRPSREIPQNTPPVPDRKTAAVLSSLIDRSRAAMGWNRLPENEQDIAIITWYEILIDAGVPVSSYTDSYRSAQQRKSEFLKQGKERSIVTPNDVAVEWEKIKDLHQEINGVKLLPEHNLASCQRCFGTGREEMPDASVRPDCQHQPFTAEEVAESAQAKAKAIELMCEAMTKIGAPKPVAAKKREPVGVCLKCSEYSRQANTLEGWQISEACGSATGTMKPDGSPVTCTGTMEIFVKNSAAGMFRAA